MDWHAVQTKPPFAADGFTNIGASDFCGQPQWQQQQQQQQHHHQQQQQQHLPPPPAYMPASAPPDYPGCQYVGAPHYGAPVYYVNSPSAAGFAQPVASQNVQVNMINGAAPPPPVIITQTAPPVSSPSSYLGWSIFNFLCCFWPLGLAAIFYSVKVGSARNPEEARSYSVKARNLNIAATAIAPIIAVAISVALTTSGVTAARNTGYNYYSYGYPNYYENLIYYTYSASYSYIDYSSSYSYYYGSIVYYSFTATGYQSVTASRYIIDFYTKYAQSLYYTG